MNSTTKQLFSVLRFVLAIFTFVITVGWIVSGTVEAGLFMNLCIFAAVLSGMVLMIWGTGD